MRGTLRDYRRQLVAVVLASVPILAGVAIAAFGLEKARHLLGIVMAVLALLLIFKAAVVAVSIGIRAFL